MARDYKDRPAPSKRARPKPARQPAPKSPPRIPGFVWGLLAGIALAAGWWWFQQVAGDKLPPAPKPLERRPPPEDARTDELPSAEEAATATNENQSLPPPRESEFSFYRLLHEYELLIPDEEEIVADSRPRPGADAEATAVAPPPELAPDTQYVIQVGSFGGAREAENRRAELALIGVTASVQPVTLRPGETWHRVRVGPLPSTSAERTVTLLQGEGFDYFVAKAR